MVKKINEQEFKEAVKTGVAVVDFSATWCGPCQMLAPVLEDVSQKMEGKVSFYNVDVDENQNLAIQYGISNIPAVAVFKDGVKQDMAVGFQPAETITKFIEQYL